MQIAKLSSNRFSYILCKLKLLVDNGADVNIVNYEGFTGMNAYIHKNSNY